MAEIPAEAVQAAAKASSLHFEFCDEPRWQDCAECVRVMEQTERGLKAAAPFIAEHALRTATREQHEEMIGRIATDAIKRERPKLLAEVEQATDQAMEKRAAAIAALARAEEHRKFTEWLQADGYPFEWSTETPAPVPPEVLAQVWRDRDPSGSDTTPMEEWTAMVREEGGWNRA